MSNTPNAISIRHLSLAIANHMILKDISLDIAYGEFIGVLGTNGAGKTTLFRAILGLLPLESGTIEVLGTNVRRGNPQIGYLPQARTINEQLHLNCREFLKSSWNGQKWGLPLGADKANRAIDHVLALTGSTNLAKRPINDLSGGERQRVLIAQSLMGNPKILILDEPLISLDPARQHDVIRLVRNIQQEMKLTVLFSAHELNPLLGSLDRVLYLGGGNAALGQVEDVVTGPVLSKLYGTEIEVIHVNSRIFVMAGASDLEQDPHLHEHIDGHHHHDHDHG
jgi:zinc/manganese transport system ATP-binding protein